MKLRLDPVPILCVAVALWLLLGGAGLGPVGSPPPFKADRLCVLIVEDSSARDGLTRDQLAAITATDDASPRAVVLAKGGEFKLLDDEDGPHLGDAAQWIRDAYAVKRDSLPWVVAADADSGFSVPLTTEADLLERLKGL